jgi:hypothetical protein
VDGEMQVILARRQLVHGDSRSQRTLRLRQTTQLRRFGGAEAGLGAVAAVADTDEAGDAAVI